MCGPQILESLLSDASVTTEPSTFRSWVEVPEMRRNLIAPARPMVPASARAAEPFAYGVKGFLPVTGGG